MGATCSRCSSSVKTLQAHTATYNPLGTAPPKKEEGTRFGKKFWIFLCCNLCCFACAAGILVAPIIVFVKYQSNNDSTEGARCERGDAANIASLVGVNCTGECFQAPYDYLRDCVKGALDYGEVTEPILTLGTCQEVCGVDMAVAMAPDYFWRPGSVCMFYRGEFPKWLDTWRLFKLTGPLRWFRGASFRNVVAECS
eukprot:TRINITY_DN37520_c0_g1_i1.p1 TRINITY_DN37520_c0_g1~~TRINITY_DN37520_c0_g1_i1.p1  ORF type:complete len:197 (+),score=15.19 TRINITY_DN37520_c0_g1_i1:62-652(+)